MHRWKNSFRWDHPGFVSVRLCQCHCRIHEVQTNPIWDFIEVMVMKTVHLNDFNSVCSKIINAHDVKIIPTLGLKHFAPHHIYLAVFDFVSPFLSHLNPTHPTHPPSSNIILDYDEWSAENGDTGDDDEQSWSSWSRRLTGQRVKCPWTANASFPSPSLILHPLHTERQSLPTKNTRWLYAADSPRKT